MHVRVLIDELSIRRPIFFVLLQIFVNIGSIFMMLNVRDSIDTPLMIMAGAAMIIWSLYLFEGLSTVFFILGLTGIAMGYVTEMGTFRRNVELLLGSALIAIFSYIEASWIFFWLNVFFALFSTYYVLKLRRVLPKMANLRPSTFAEPTLPMLQGQGASLDRSSFEGQAHLPLKQRRTPRSSGP